MEILNFFDLDDVEALFYYVTMILISFLQKILPNCFPILNKTRNAI